MPDSFGHSRALGKFVKREKRLRSSWFEKSAFAGVHPRKKHLIMTVKSVERLDGQRILKTEQV